MFAVRLALPLRLMRLSAAGLSALAAMFASVGMASMAD